MNAPTYHLWLMPSRDRYAALAGVIGNLARELGAPVFEPHVTLLSGLEGHEPEHLRRAQALAKQLQPTRIDLTEPSYTDRFFQCLFMHVAATPEVLRLRSLAEQAYQRDPAPYMPHLSLVYGTFPPALKQAVIARLPGDSRTSFMVDTLHLIRADSTAPQDWHQVARFDFNTGQRG